jgi:hypothetical protein
MVKACDLGLASREVPRLPSATSAQYQAVLREMAWRENMPKTYWDQWLSDSNYSTVQK